MWGPTVGIVVPAFNAARFLPETLMSVRAQEYDDFLCCIVDDGSTDDTARIAAHFCDLDDRFSTVSIPNGGQSAANNRGLAELSDRVEYVCCLDSDDVLRPDALRRLVAAAESDRTRVGAHGLAVRIDPAGRPLDDLRFEEFGRDREDFGPQGLHVVDRGEPTTFQSLALTDRMIPPSVALVRTTALAKADGYNPALAPLGRLGPVPAAGSARRLHLRRPCDGRLPAARIQHERQPGPRHRLEGHPGAGLRLAREHAGPAPGLPAGVASDRGPDRPHARERLPPGTRHRCLAHRAARGHQDRRRPGPSGGRRTDLAAARPGRLGRRDPTAGAARPRAGSPISAKFALAPSLTAVVDGGAPYAGRVTDRRRRPTLRDIATETGLSPAAVSYALRGLQVPPETQQRVREAADRIGYQVDPIARALALGRTGNVGVLCGSLDDFWQQSIAAALGRGLLEAERQALIVDAANDPEIEADLAQRLVDQRVDALIVLPVDPCGPQWKKLADDTVLVSIGDALPGAATAAEVVFDNTWGVTEALTSLAAVGHRRVAVLTPLATSTPDRPAEAVVHTVGPKLAHRRRTAHHPARPRRRARGRDRTAASVHPSERRLLPGRLDRLRRLRGGAHPGAAGARGRVGARLRRPSGVARADAAAVDVPLADRRAGRDGRAAHGPSGRRGQAQPAQGAAARARPARIGRPARSDAPPPLAGPLIADRAGAAKRHRCRAVRLITVAGRRDLGPIRCAPTSPGVGIAEEWLVVAADPDHGCADCAGRRAGRAAGALPGAS